MNWLEFFFGWLIKEHYKTTMLDGIMFIIELSIIVFLYIVIRDFIEKRGDK